MRYYLVSPTAMCYRNKFMMFIEWNWDAKYLYVWSKEVPFICGTWGQISVFAYAQERHSNENRKRESVCTSHVEESVRKRDNKQPSVCCDEGDFVCASQQAKESLRETERARQTFSVCLLCAEREGLLHVCQTCFSSNSYAAGSVFSLVRLMRWIKANVSSPTLWLTENSIQTRNLNSWWRGIT